MLIQKNLHRPLAAAAAAGFLTVGFCLGHLTVTHAQDASPPPAREPGAPPPPPPGEGPGPRGGRPGPRGERPPPPRPEDDAPAIPVDPQAAPTAVKTATDAAASFAPGQVWVHTAPRGEQRVQATVLFQNKEVARLEFDAADGSLMTRGQRPPMPPPTVPDDQRRGPGVGPDAPRPDTAPPLAAKQSDGAPVPPARPANSPAPTAPVDLDRVKAHLADIVKGLRVGQGAEIMGREGFWKVPLIQQNRVVGELRLSADGTKIIQDFAAARDAAVFAR